MGVHMWKLTEQMQRVKRKLAGPTPQTVLFNALHGEMSYPLSTGDCRMLHYPDLDILYDACDKVGARCGHVYMYRDPYEVVNSARIRGLNPTILAATKTYYSMLNIIYSQFAAYPERTLGCWGFFDERATDASLWDSVQKTLLWESKEEFQTALQMVIHERHPPLSQQQRSELIPNSLVPAMDSLVKAHVRTLELCQTQARQNGMSPWT